MTHLNSRTVDQHERALKGVEPDHGQFVIVYVVGALIFASGIVAGYGLAILVLA